MSRSSESSPLSPQYTMRSSLGESALAFTISSAEPDVAQRESDLRLGEREGDFLRAQKRHRRHHDAAGLHHREISGNHHRAVRPTQQHAIAGNKPEVARKHIGDAVHPLSECGISQRFGSRDEAGPFALPARHPVLDQLDRAIEARGIFQLRETEKEIRPLSAGRQVVARKRIDMRRRVQRRVCVVVCRRHGRNTPTGELLC